MSYPACIQPLVIEDEPEVKALYENILAGLGTAPPRFAFCYDDAIKQLELSTVFHLVLLDLRLPQSAGLPAPDSLDLGLALLDACIKRDWYPIPALLIVSGHVGKASQTALREKVDSSFPCGHVLVKSSDPDQLREEIGKAVEAVRRYVSVGVHLRDAGRTLYPTISPREEDLLRRAVLSFDRGVGLDIAWWSANRFSIAEQPDAEWTKVLMGRFMLSGGDRPSRPHFFKLYSSVVREGTVGAARGLASKLQHVSVVADVGGPTRSLLVTQAVVSGDLRPVSLRQWLTRIALSTDDITSVAKQVVRQIDAMGEGSPNVQPLGKFFSKHLDDAILNQEWSKWGQSLGGESGGENPLVVMQEVRAKQGDHRYSEQTFVHGDLHAENIALDIGDYGVNALLFDAGATARAPRLKDLAALEVSVLLHLENRLRPEVLDGLYEATSSTTDQSPQLVFVRGLRANCLAADESQWPIYALLVLDQALVQLATLSYDVSGNRIRNPHDAARVAARAAKWVRALLLSPGP